LLTDGLIKLRPVQPDDAEEMYAAIRESIAEIAPWLYFAHDGYSLKEARDFLKRCPRNWKKDTEYVFGIIDARDGTYLGTCGLNRMDTENLRANLGYWTRTSRMGQGVAPAATVLLARWGFKELKLRRIEIIVATENVRSQRVAEKAGAYREGILRHRIKINDRMHDAVMYSLVPGDI
jgi:ribosomal-protein-serine acetyltransferase